MQALRGKANIFPLSAVPLYTQQIRNHASALLKSLQMNGASTAVIQGAVQLVKALGDIPSDVTIAPNDIADAVRRMRHSQPKTRPFQQQDDVHSILDAVETMVAAQQELLK